MIQHTEIWQTKQLIELGFEKPKSEVKAEQSGDCAWYNPAYSIDELIEMLPNNLVMHREKDKWSVSIGEVSITKTELIDALFELLTH